MKLPFSAGTLAALSAYSMWGLIPLLFRLMDKVNAGAIVAHRILWSVLLVGGLLIAFRRLDQVRRALADHATLRGIFFAAVLLCGNWLIYVWAVNSERVLETSFGYFINPLVNVAIGVILLKERLNKLQIIAISIATVAVIVMAVGIGGLPWISLALALSFGFYGYFRKTVNVGAMTGLWLEVAMLAPFALGFLFWLPAGQGIPHDLGTLVLLAITGPATALPLLCFAFAAKRLHLSTMGMFQYIAPSIQFLIGVFLFHEPINTIQMGSFVLIWLSLAIFTANSLRQASAPKPVA